MATQQCQLRLVQIGANVGDFAQGRAGRSDGGCSDMGATVAGDHLRNPNVTAILAEASPQNFRELQDNLAGAGMNGQHRSVNAAVCNTSGKLVFYSVSPDFADEFPDAPFYAKSEIKSFDRNHVLRTLRWVLGPSRDRQSAF